MTELIKQEVLNASIFKEDKKIESLVLEVKTRADEYVYDLDTKGGRAAIASFALKIAKCKTAIDNIGKDLVSDAKAEIKLVDNKRKFARDSLDALKESFRKPLTEIEDAEKARVATLNDGINKIREDGEVALREWINYTANELSDLLVSTEQKDDGTWEEFNDNAVKAIADAVTNINSAISKRTQYDIEQDQLAELKKQAEAKQQQERDERIAKEAVEKAKSDGVITIAPKFVDNIPSDKAVINNQIKDSFIQLGNMSESDAKTLVIAIARGGIKNLQIIY